MTDAEAAVRSYLTFVSDPAVLVDDATVCRLQARVDRATDPIARLKALAELERARTPNGVALESAFVQHAKAWAEANDVPVSAFRSFGVADDVLKAAGFTVRSHARTRGQRIRAHGTRRRSGPSTTQEDVRTYILAQHGDFTLTSVTADVGGSPMTVRKAVRSLVEAGKVEQAGTVREEGAKGRSSIRYRLSSSRSAARPKRAKKA